MTQNRWGLFAGIVGAALLALPLYAHHAGSLYDREHPVTMTGTVTKYLFTNPHVAIHYEVKDEAGNVEQWVAESAPPQRLYRAGWNTKTLKPGDQITITGGPSKDGRKYMSVKKLVGPDWQSLTQGAE